MVYSNFHVIFFAWTFLSITINTVTPNCFYQSQKDQNDFYSDWICEEMTLSSKNPFVDLQYLNKTDMDTFGFLNVSGEFDSAVLQNFTHLKKLFIADSRFDKFELQCRHLKSIMIVRTVVPNGTTLANCCPNLEKIIIKSSKGFELENDGFIGLKRLKSLQIKHENIGNLTRNTFKGLTKLKYLTLINNSIDSIEKDTFVDIINLTELSIEDDNLTSIDLNVFEPLTKLTTLTIYGERLQRLPLDMFINQRQITEIGLPFKSWIDIEVEKLPQMFPRLGFFSYKSRLVSSEEEKAIIKKQKKLAKMLFGRTNT